jgi:hypothetical protein
VVTLVSMAGIRIFAPPQNLCRVLSAKERLGILSWFDDEPHSKLRKQSGHCMETSLSNSQMQSAPNKARLWLPSALIVAALGPYLGVLA